MRNAISSEISFAADVRPLFRDKDISSMKKARNLDLSNYDDVSVHADDILDRLQMGDMPCDGAWAAKDVDTFSKWISDGKRP